MKHLKLFEEFSEEKKEILYHELDENKLSEFLDNYKEEPVDDKLISRISKFIEKNGIDAKSAILDEKQANTILIESDDDDEESSSSMDFMITTYSDNWFLVNIFKRLPDEEDDWNQNEWSYKCDTIKGLWQLLMNWDYFFNEDNSHWDDDQNDWNEDSDEYDYEDEEEDSDDWDDEEEEEEDDDY